MQVKPSKQVQSKGNTVRVIGILEPWAPQLRAEGTVGIQAHSEGEALVEPTYVDNAGRFILDFEVTPSTVSALHAGDVEVRAVDRSGRLLGSARLRVAKGQALVGMKLRMDPLQSPVGKVENISKDIVPQQTIKRLAAQAAHLQGVTIREAKAPRAVMKAIRELNEVGQLANRVLTGEMEADVALRRILGEAIMNSPGGVPSGAAPVILAGLNAIIDTIGTKFSASACGPGISEAAQALTAGFVMDLKEKNRNGWWTRQARAYIRDRASTVNAYLGSVERAHGEYSEIGGYFSRYPIDGDDASQAVLPPDESAILPPEPNPEEEFGGVGLEVCAGVSDLCMSLFESSLVAALAEQDQYVGLIRSVEPNCLGCNYNQSQIFKARPATGRSFPSQRPADVDLYFRNEVITGSITQWNQNEIHFVIPPHLYNQSGFVGLRGPNQPLAPIVVNRGVLERLCGISVPPLPDIGNSLSPGAFISVIHPPVFDLFTASGVQDQWPETPCTAPMELCWRTHLVDQTVADQIHPCGRIEVIIRDSEGNQMASGGASGCVSINLSEERTFMAEATSYAGQTLCGQANPQTLVVQPVHHLRLIRNDPAGMEIPGDTNGSVIVEVSCPAPAGGIEVQLQSSDPARLQVQPTVTIPTGETRIRVPFRTGEPTIYNSFCGVVEVSASAVKHHQGRLRYEIYRAPILSWRTLPPDLRAFKGISPLDVFQVTTDCVPNPLSRMRWQFVRTDPDGQAGELTPTVEFSYTPSTYNVMLSDTDAEGLTAGTWSLVAEIPDRNVESNSLEFSVVPCLTEITLHSVMVVEGQSGPFEGGLELAVTTTIDGMSRTWPESGGHQNIGVGRENILTPDLPIARVEFRDSPTKTVDITIILDEEDGFLLFDNETGSGQAKVTIACDQVLDTKVWIVIDGRTARIEETTPPIPVYGGDTGLGGEITETGDQTPRFALGDGMVELVFRATPL